jgi:hypothetical protein
VTGGVPDPDTGRTVANTSPPPATVVGSCCGAAVTLRLGAGALSNSVTDPGALVASS